MDIELPYGNTSIFGGDPQLRGQVEPVKAEYLTIGFLAGELSGRLDRSPELIRGVTDRRFDCLGWYYDNQLDFQEMSSIYVFKHGLEKELSKHPEARGFELCGTSMGVWGALIRYNRFTRRFGEVYAHNDRFKKRADRRIREKSVHHLKDLVEEALKSV